MPAAAAWPPAELQARPAYLRAFPAVDPDADCVGRLIPAVPERAAGPVRLPALQAELRRALQEVLHPVSREVSRLEWQASLQRVASWAPAQRQVLADVRRQVAVASRHARRAQPEAHSADVALQAQSKAHRQAVSRPMAQVLRQELCRVLAEAALRGARPEAAEVPSSARAQPLELPQVAEAAGQP